MPEACEQGVWVFRLNEGGYEPGDRLVAFIEPERVDKDGCRVERRQHCCDVMAVLPAGAQLSLLTFGCKFVIFGFDHGDGRQSTLQVRASPPPI